MPKLPRIKAPKLKKLVSICKICFISCLKKTKRISLPRNGYSGLKAVLAHHFSTPWFSHLGMNYVFSMCAVLKVFWPVIGSFFVFMIYMGACRSWAYPSIRHYVMNEYSRKLFIGKVYRDPAIAVPVNPGLLNDPSRGHNVAIFGTKIGRVLFTSFPYHRNLPDNLYSRAA